MKSLIDMRPFLAVSLAATACPSDEAAEVASTEGSGGTTQVTLETLSISAGAGAGADGMGDVGDGGPDVGGTSGEDLPPRGERTAFVHLFEWPWASVARECEAFLGPAGYGAVQVSPPQEYPADVEGSPWWDRYQPVSYTIDGRSGDREAFADMVERCQAVGVDIYVDAVINHMAWTHHGVGVSGTEFVEYEYPPLFDPTHFHPCRESIQDYGNRTEVQTCELFGLPDLDTSQLYVQDQLTAYLQDLMDLGVAGFRVDAAKHIDADELGVVFDGLSEPPVIFMEVIADETIPSSEYVAMGRVTEFGYGRELSNAVREGNLSALANFGEPWGLVPSGQAVVFVDNHDNQRGHGNGEGVLTHRSPQAYRLANVFMLAWPYGYPKVMSSFAFEDDDERPPLGDDGLLLPVHDDADECQEPWVCEHRWPQMAPMVAFRNHCRDADVSDWWDDGGSAIGFARNGCGYVALNAGNSSVEATVATSLPEGAYCDRLADDCSSPITVADDGSAVLTIPGQGFVVFDTAG